MHCPGMSPVILLRSSRGIEGVTRSENCAQAWVCSSRSGFCRPLHSPLKLQAHRPMAHCRPTLAGAGAFEATIQHLRSLLSDRDRQLGRLEAEVAMLRAGQTRGTQNGRHRVPAGGFKCRGWGRWVPADQSKLAAHA